MVPVEITTLSLFSSAQRIEGIKYEYDLPTPVPASKTPILFSLKHSVIFFTREICTGLSS